MAEYRYEIHSHSSDVSKCGHNTSEEMIHETMAHGYSGIVVTEHINGATFRDMPDADWQTKVDHYLTGFRNSIDAAGSGFSVFLGVEFNFRENYNDYLVYGLDEEMLRRELDNTILDWGIVRFSAFCRDHGLLLLQAHPFREYMSMVKPELIDGIEILNAHPRHDSRNFLARAYGEYCRSREFPFVLTAGSDAHGLSDVGRSGIVTDRRLTDIGDVVRELRSGARLIVPEDQRVYFDGKAVFETKGETAK